MTKTITSPKAFLQRFVLGSSSKNLKKTLGLGALALGLALIAATTPKYLRASDHDDGEVDTKGRNLNLTDLFVFREQDQNPSAAAGNLVFIMNTNPRSMPRQPYYFSNTARYEFQVERVPDKNASPTTAYANPDVVMRFEFSEPTGSNPYKQQQILLTVIRDGQIVANRVNAGTTTPIINSNNPTAPYTPTVTPVAVAGSTLSVFAGLREDPFFFDVEQFFRVRAGALGFGPAVGFRPPNQAIDDFKDVNVNAIAVRVPISMLQGSSSATTFDVWETISVADGNGGFTQMERLARPAVNEGLLVTNDFLNALNMVGPDFEAAALNKQLPQTPQPQPQPSPAVNAPRTLAEIIAARRRGNQPPARPQPAPAQPNAGLNGNQQAQADAIFAEANKTLLALGNNQQRANILVGAFLPDVMRMDTTQVSNYSPSIIGTSCLNTKSSPICGRKLKDDVVDTTLTVLTDSKITSDNVSYEGNSNNPAQGHKPLETSFPYLALPN